MSTNFTPVIPSRLVPSLAPPKKAVSVSDGILRVALPVLLLLGIAFVAYALLPLKMAIAVIITVGLTGLFLAIRYGISADPVSLPVVGLKRTRQNCWVNALVQVLMGNKMIREKVLSLQEHHLLYSLKKVWVAYEKAVAEGTSCAEDTTVLQNVLLQRYRGIGTPSNTGEGDSASAMDRIYLELGLPPLPWVGRNGKTSSNYQLIPLNELSVADPIGHEITNIRYFSSEPPFIWFRVCHSDRSVQCNSLARLSMLLEVPIQSASSQKHCAMAAFVVHRSQSKHAVAFRKEAGVWYELDDANVRSVSLDQVKQELRCATLVRYDPLPLVVGLKNVGNSCWLNAVVQVLIGDTEIRQKVLALEETHFLHPLKKLWIAYEEASATGTDCLENTAALSAVVVNKYRLAISNGMGDASEAFRELYPLLASPLRWKDQKGESNTSNELSAVTPESLSVQKPFLRAFRDFHFFERTPRSIWIEHVFWNSGSPEPYTNLSEPFEIPVEGGAKTSYRMAAFVSYQSPKHYIAFRRDGEIWYELNDALVTSVSLARVEEKLKSAKVIRYSQS